jgi:Mrp family chromosome partitioning ATPase
VGTEAEGALLPATLEGPAARGIKLLRAMVLRRMQPRGWNTLAVVSPAPGDGRTFIASNLAIAIAAENDLTALLVDLDLRKPVVHERFGVSPAAGIADCLDGSAPLSAALLAVEEYPGLVLLPGRDPVARSSEALGSQRARALFRELKDRYVNRFVIYDLPPVLSGDDAVVFASQADAVLVVVGDDRTRRNELVQCLELLQHVPVLGTVLNASQPGRRPPGQR